MRTWECIKSNLYKTLQLSTDILLSKHLAVAVDILRLELVPVLFQREFFERGPRKDSLRDKYDLSSLARSFSLSFAMIAIR